MDVLFYITAVSIAFCILDFDKFLCLQNFLKKKESNVADGLLNFTSENKKLKFRGYIDLKLNNTFNKGEKININWSSFGNQKQNFNSSILIPYIYNSKFSIDIASLASD